MLISEEQVITVLKTLEIPCSVRPPGRFNFMPKHWGKWKKRFLRFVAASGICYMNEELQINVLLHLLGPQAEELFLQLETLEENRESLTMVDLLDQLDRHFHLINRPLYARFLFHRRMQRPHESVGEFIRVVYLLADACCFGEKQDEILRDKVVIGMRNETARQRLLLHDNLTLEQAVAAARNAEIRQVRSYGSR